MISEAVFWFSAACFLLLVGYLLGMHTRHRARLGDAIALKTLLEAYEAAVIAYYACPGSPELAALKEARAHLAWRRLYDET